MFGLLITGYSEEEGQEGEEEEVGRQVFVKLIVELLEFRTTGKS
jgi:hypothetical protein